MKRKRSSVRKARTAIEKQALSMEEHGARMGRLYVQVGGQRPISAMKILGASKRDPLLSEPKAPPPRKRFIYGDTWNAYQLLRPDAVV